MIIAGLFLLAIGLFLDSLNLVWSIQVIRKGKGPSKVWFFPVLFYFFGLNNLFATSHSLAFWLIFGFLVFLHSMCAFGIQVLGNQRKS